MHLLLKLSFLQGGNEHLQHGMNLLANRDSSGFPSNVMQNELNHPQWTLVICCGYKQVVLFGIFKSCKW